MDPASLSNLDPKLKETYERVMGTNTPASTAPAEPAKDATPTLSTIPADPLPPSDSSASQLPVNEAIPPSTPVATEPEQQPATVTINQPLPSTPTSTIINKPHGHSGLIKVFYVLGATVFFIIYIFFWAKIFNIQLPF